MSTISLSHISKEYKRGIRTVEDFSLEIGEHEFVVLVGPSGCGKSTLLRMIPAWRRSRAENSGSTTG